MLVLPGLEAWEEVLPKGCGLNGKVRVPSRVDCFVVIPSYFKWQRGRVREPGKAECPLGEFLSGDKRACAGSFGNNTGKKI